jgi:hypothetical protein
MTSLMAISFVAIIIALAFLEAFLEELSVGLSATGAAASASATGAASAASTTDVITGTWAIRVSFTTLGARILGHLCEAGSFVGTIGRCRAVLTVVVGQ